MIVDTDITVTFDYESLPPSNGTRTVTTSDRQLNSSTFQGVVEFSFVVPSDDNMLYVCVSRIVPLNSTQYVHLVTNPSRAHRLELTGKFIHYIANCAVSLSYVQPFRLQWLP